ncbi:helix-turn-helix transcriptional regulator [Streptomyces dysideae]|uniref:HTH luxR-type domain-containing protein n=1 Tax=Streptomyces dysideae TaxID=909626 RepID=A0A124IE03_9ACTN|nr:helix-turn-helix transcriptional regulator [Streptomyces dysideae]KUO16777.1 hypothetical protein AQJ91_33970 [Streptomyces dysideae]
MYALTDLAHRLLQTTLADPSITLRDAARSLGLTEEELALGLDELARAGLVRRLEGRGELVTLTPDAVFARLVALQQEATRARLAALERTDATLGVLSASLMRLRAEGGTVPQTRRLVGGREISGALEGVAAQARTEVLSMHPGSPLPQAMLKDSMKRNREVIDRGATMRSVHLSSMLKVPHGRAHLEGLRDAGAEVRVTSVLPFRLVMVDRVVAYVPEEPQDEGPGAELPEMTALEIRDPSMIALFRAVFEFCWMHGSAALGDDVPGVDEVGEELDSRELSLVRMLGRGMKDDAIARSLGISSRTLRRMMTEVMRKLDADSRFQAGAHAAARGWLDVRTETF